jgi:hypothetical protein
VKNTFVRVAVGFSLLFMLVAFSDTAHAALFMPTTAAVPEVDPASTAAALALLAGSYFVAVSKFRRK